MKLRNWIVSVQQSHLLVNLEQVRKTVDNKKNEERVCKKFILLHILNSASSKQFCAWVRMHCRLMKWTRPLKSSQFHTFTYPTHIIRYLCVHHINLSYRYSVFKEFTGALMTTPFGWAWVPLHIRSPTSRKMNQGKFNTLLLQLLLALSWSLSGYLLPCEWWVEATPFR